MKTTENGLASGAYVSPISLGVFMKSVASLLFFCSSVFAGWAHAQPCVEPVQVELFIEMPAEPGASTDFSHWIGNGLATVSGTVTNQGDGQTAQIDLRFDYTTPEGVFFDELIECIEGAIEGAAPALINTHLINLNPNRGVTLAYRLTLYRPSDSSYRLRLRVSGNYE